MADFARSIIALFKQRLDRPLWLLNVATADQPTTTDLGANKGALDYDITLNLPSYYTGTVWTPLAAYNANIASLATATQGDLIYASGTDTWAKLAKNASATRYLSNTGASNNPAWAQVDLTNGVTGILPSSNGGTANAFFTVAGPASSTKTYTFPNASGSVPLLVTSNIFSAANAVQTLQVTGAAIPPVVGSGVEVSWDGTTGNVYAYDRNGSVFKPMTFGGTILDFAISGTRCARVLGDSAVPASAGATGVKGSIAWDTGFIYICTATDTWKRVAIATW